MASKKQLKSLPVDKLRWQCNPDVFRAESSGQIESSEEIIGQTRAVEAIKLGLEVNSLGYNIFITGLAGTGRTTTIKKLLQQLESSAEPPPDLLYVYNFQDTDRPRVIYLPAGMGFRFREDMEKLIHNLSENLGQLFESDMFKNKRKNIVRKYQDLQKSLLENFQEEIKKENFALVQVQVGQYPKLDLQPLFDGKPISFEELSVLVQEDKIPKEVEQQFIDKYHELEGRLEEVFKKGKDMAAELDEKLKKLSRTTAKPFINTLINDIKDHYDSTDVDLHLDQVANHIMEHLDDFLQKEKSSSNQMIIPGQPQQPQRDPFLPYRANLLVDNRKTKGRPIITETNPTFTNLFGVIERDYNAIRGAMRTDFTKIKAGSLLRATGGFLVVNAIDVLVEPGVWQNLKRMLRNNIIQIQNYDPFYLTSSSALKPESIKANIKIVMIGDQNLYYMLSAYDEDFRKIFKVKAEFDYVMEKNKETIQKYAIFINKICSTEHLHHFDRSGMAAVAEFGVRLGGRTNKLSTRFNVIADMIREANYWARKDDQQLVNYDHVQKAIKSWIKRVNMPEDKLQELYDEGVLMVDVKGEQVGQINGLSVFSLGEYAFGRPVRITVTTALGRKGIINIEREADLSGKTHNKGVLILEGYLRRMFAQDKLLQIDASICFEQSYSGIDGDSASSTEMYGLLSALGDIPLRQDLAVTGSLNQNGDVQPIGGVNEKIEGFFKVCKSRKLTGTQGVLIPHTNVPDLMLDHQIVEACEKGKFHIYPIKRIEEGIELLTGIPAGKRNAKGEFTKDSVFYRVNQKLEQMAKLTRRHEEKKLLALREEKPQDKKKKK
ncbi:MAG: AAA family ATPase [candidate division Zixibacteria bacterium]|nr:AAA family ATPase [candidate division Zixibacteria bacterium]